MNINRVGTLVVLGWALIVMSGCAAAVLAGAGAGAGVGTYSYVDGFLKRNYAASISDAYNAALAALADMKLTPTLKKQDAFTGRIEGKMADGSDFFINLTARPKNITEIEIKIGIFGNRDRSQVFHERIAAKLTK